MVTFSPQNFGTLALLTGLGTLAANRPGASAAQALGQGGLSGINMFNQIGQQAQMQQLRNLQIQQARASMAMNQQRQAMLASLFGGQPATVTQPTTPPTQSAALPDPSMAPGGPVVAGPALPTPLMVGTGPTQAAAQAAVPPAPPSTVPGQPASQPGMSSTFQNPNLPIALAAAGLPNVSNAVAQSQAATAAAARAAASSRRQGDKDRFDRANTLRDEYMRASEGFVDLGNSFRRIQTLGTNASPAGDVGMIFSFMKMLDPTSVVREGEQATAREAGEVPDRILNLYNRVVMGETLSPKQRADFVRQSQRIFENQRDSQERLENRYLGLSERNDVNPENVLVYRYDDFASDLVPPQTAPQTQTAPDTTQTMEAGPGTSVTAPTVGATIGTDMTVPEGTTGEIDGDPVVYQGGEWVPIEEPESVTEPRLSGARGRRQRRGR